MKWLKQICQPQFGLIDSLITMFIDKIEEQTLTMKILKILRKLNELLPELVMKCFFANKKFPNSVVKYIEITEMKDLAGDAFILLINVFPQLKFEKLNDEFVEKLVSCIEFITDDNTQNSLISILV